MMTNAKIGVALVGGYVLGRTKKAKLAIGLGMYLAGKRLNLDPRQLGKLVANSPVLGPLNDQIRGELVDATKSAATSALTQRMSTLTDSLHERTLALSDAGGSGRGEEPSDERESAEHRESDDDLPDDDEAEDPEDTEDKRSAPSGKRTAGSSARSGKPAANKSSAGKTSATKTSAKTSAAKTSQRAKSTKTTKPGTSAKAAASGARKAGAGTRKKAAGTARATAARGGRDD
ncbi:hypothetical protein [Streptomyces kronopolitis]